MRLFVPLIALALAAASPAGAQNGGSDDTPPDTSSKTRALPPPKATDEVQKPIKVLTLEEKQQLQKCIQVDKRPPAVCRKEAETASK